MARTEVRDADGKRAAPLHESRVFTREPGAQTRQLVGSIWDS